VNQDRLRTLLAALDVEASTVLLSCTHGQCVDKLYNYIQQIAKDDQTSGLEPGLPQWDPYIAEAFLEVDILAYGGSLEPASSGTLAGSSIVSWLASAGWGLGTRRDGKLTLVPGLGTADTRADLGKNTEERDRVTDAVPATLMYKVVAQDRSQKGRLAEAEVKTKEHGPTGKPKKSVKRITPAGNRTGVSTTATGVTPPITAEREEAQGSTLDLPGVDKHTETDLAERGRSGNGAGVDVQKGRLRAAATAKKGESDAEEPAKTRGRGAVRASEESSPKRGGTPKATERSKQVTEMRAAALALAAGLVTVGSEELADELVEAVSEVDPQRVSVEDFLDLPKVLVIVSTRTAISLRTDTEQHGHFWQITRIPNVYVNKKLSCMPGIKKHFTGLIARGLCRSF
jgi:hypothetical protein